MSPASIVKFGDLKDSPSVYLPLPTPIPIGTKVELAITLHRKNGTRTEELKISGEYKVTSVRFTTTGGPRQHVVLESLHVAPSWKAVRNPPGKKPAPAKSPRKVVS
jgi:hypothetical protein